MVAYCLWWLLIVVVSSDRSVDVVYSAAGVDDAAAGDVVAKATALQYTSHSMSLHTSNRTTAPLCRTVSSSSLRSTVMAINNDLYLSTVVPFSKIEIATSFHRNFLLLRKIVSLRKVFKC